MGLLILVTARRSLHSCEEPFSENPVDVSRPAFVNLNVEFGAILSCGSLQEIGSACSDHPSEGKRSNTEIAGASWGTSHGGAASGAAAVRIQSFKMP